MTPAESTKKRHLLFLVTEDWYFCSHRLPLARAAIAADYSVTVVTNVVDRGAELHQAGIRVIPFQISRGQINPLRDVATLARLIAIYRRERPDLVHHVAMKPVLYGSLAARLSGTAGVVNALAGMGWLFLANGRGARVIKGIVRVALGRLLRAGTVIVQNPVDRDALIGMGVPAARIVQIAGSGVDLDQFRPRAEPSGPPIVLLSARLLWDKGVGEFIAAARQLRSQGVRAEFWLAGEPDVANPAAIPAHQIAEWVQEGIVRHWGWVSGSAMPDLLARCHVACLPSYREGLPKSLIEAAASGRPIVTTDVPGCRDVVRHEDNGLLVPARDAIALAAALRRLIENTEQRTAMGARGRARAESEFGLRGVIDATLALYSVSS